MLQGKPPTPYDRTWPWLLLHMPPYDRTWSWLLLHVLVRLLTAARTVFQVEWDLNTVPKQTLIRPIIKMPKNHPAVSDANCSCGPLLTYGDPIPSTDVAMFNKEGTCENTTGAPRPRIEPTLGRPKLLDAPQRGMPGSRVPRRRVPSALPPRTKYLLPTHAPGGLLTAAHAAQL